MLFGWCVHKMYYNIIVEKRHMEDRLRRKYSRVYRRRANHRKIVVAGIVVGIVVILAGLSLWLAKREENSRKTIANLMLTAIKPVGSTMYIWGGGWGDENITKEADSVRIGISPRWAEFAAKQDSDYDFNRTRYQRHDGLDCSGYIGWCIYNVMETKSGQDGYVMKATKMASTYAKWGWGDFTEAEAVKDWKAGDIMSMDGHVWMVVGSCKDGSVVFLHSTPPGVSLAGTLLSDGSESEATRLAESYMSTYYPDWYERYPECGKEYSYLTTSEAMRWNRKTLRDEEGLTKKSAEEVLEWMFSNQQKKLENIVPCTKR